jgi:hypothetical protein
VIPSSKENSANLRGEKLRCVIENQGIRNTKPGNDELIEERDYLIFIKFLERNDFSIVITQNATTMHL